MEPNQAKRDLLLSAPSATPEQALAMTSLFGINSALFYDHESQRPFVFPQDYAVHYGFIQDWYFLVGQLTVIGPTGATGPPGFPMGPIGPISSSTPSNPYTDPIDYAFVLVFQNNTFMGPKLLQAHEDPRSAAVQQIEFTFTSIADQKTLAAPPTVIWATNVKSTTFPFSFKVTDDYTLQGSSPNGDILPLTAHAYNSKDGAGIDLQCVAQKGMLLQGNQGFVGVPNTGEGWGYFSFPVLSLTGTITYQGSTLQVTGLGWLDKQWGTVGQTTNGWLRYLGDMASVFRAPPNVSGWNWFAVQLENNVQFTGAYATLYNSQGIVEIQPTHTAFYGNLFPASGPSFEIKGTITIHLLEFITSPHTKATYPIKWEISAPSEELNLTLIARSPMQFGFSGNGTEFAENACEVKGVYRGDPVRGLGWGENVGFQTQDQTRGAWLETAGLPNTETNRNIIINADLDTARSNGVVYLVVTIGLILLVLVLIVGLIVGIAHALK